MVNPCCTLLFSRKKIIKFSEVALVSVHWNCLIGCIIIARGYRPWNTANDTSVICLLVKDGYETLKQNAKFCSIFFISHLAALRPTMVHWAGDSLIHPILIITLFQVRPKGHRKPRNEVGSESLAERIIEIRAQNLPFLSVTCYPTVSFCPKVY